MLSFKDNFEVNNEIKDVTKTFEAPEHILLIQSVGLEETACIVLSFVFLLSSQLQRAPEPPFLFDRRLQFGPQPALFLFLLWFFPGATLWGVLDPTCPFPSAPCLFLKSPQQNVMLFLLLFLFLYCFCVFVLNFFLSY